MVRASLTWAAAIISIMIGTLASLAVASWTQGVLSHVPSAEQVALTAVGDCRDSLPVLSLLFRAYEIVAVDPAAEFARVAALADAPDNPPLLDFPARDEDDRSLASMGYVEVVDDTGFRFERTW